MTVITHKTNNTGRFDVKVSPNRKCFTASKLNDITLRTDTTKVGID